MLLLTFIQVLVLTSKERILYSGLPSLLQQSMTYYGFIMAVWFLVLQFLYAASLQIRYPQKCPQAVGLIIQQSLVSNSVKYYISIHKVWSLKIRATLHAIVCSTNVQSKNFLECYIIVIFFNTSCPLVSVNLWQMALSIWHYWRV